jgi:hypothetical protein
MIQKAMMMMQLAGPPQPPADLYQSLPPDLRRQCEVVDKFGRLVDAHLVEALRKGREVDEKIERMLKDGLLKNNDQFRKLWGELKEQNKKNTSLPAVPPAGGR